MIHREAKPGLPERLLDEAQPQLLPAPSVGWQRRAAQQQEAASLPSGVGPDLLVTQLALHSKNFLPETAWYVTYSSSRAIPRGSGTCLLGLGLLGNPEHSPNA